MAEGGSAVQSEEVTETVTVTHTETETDSQPVLHLRLRKPSNPRKVSWQSGTVDNEHLGKKKSKCCCVYRRPHAFGESSSDEEDECKNCWGHRVPKHRPEGGSEGAEPAPSGPSPSSDQ